MFTCLTIHTLPCILDRSDSLHRLLEREDEEDQAEQEQTQTHIQETIQYIIA